MQTSVLVSCLLVLFATACASNSRTPFDAGSSEAGLSDAGFSDAGLSDAGPSDAGLSDAGPSDAGPSDAGALCGDGIVDEGERCDGDCPTECDDGVACTSDELVGSSASCDARCEHAPVALCEAGDGCCPEGCDATTDSDCSATCGNGVVELLETCDGDCPAACDDGVACTADARVGSASTCSAACSFAPISACSDDDGCCPAGCDATSDADCSPSCGNGVVEPPERCDGDCQTSCDDGVACTTDAMVGSASTCSAACSFAPISACSDDDGCCPAGCDATSDADCSPFCGNGVVEPPELCDGDCPTSCDDGLVCTADTLVGSGCSAACSSASISACADGDGCCPAGCRFATDDDCPSALWHPVVGEHTADGIDELFLVRLASAGAAVLRSPFAGGWPVTAEVFPAGHTSLSPDGRYAYFVADAHTDEAADLYLIDLAEDEPVAQRITTLPGANHSVYTVQWSPDGTRLAYSADPTDRGWLELFAIDLRSGLASASPVRVHGTPVTGGGLYQRPGIGPVLAVERDDTVSWSSDSERLYFVADLRIAGRPEAHVYEVASGTTRLLLAPLGSGERVERIVGMGATLAVLHADLDGSGRRNLFAVDAASPPAAPVRLNHPLATAGREVLGALWPSPDRTRLLFNGDLDTDGVVEGFYVDLSAGLPATAGAAVRAHPPFASAAQRMSSASWAPTSDRYLLVGTLEGDGERRGYVGDVRGGAPSGAPLDPAQPAFTDFGITNAIWRPDGRGLAATVDRFVDQQIELVYFDLSGAVPADPIRLTPALSDPEMDVTSPAFWVSNEELIYSATHDAVRRGDVFLLRLSSPGAPTRLSGPFSASLPATGRVGLRPVHLRPDGLLLAEGDHRLDNVIELVSIDLSSPGSHRALHPAFAGSRDVLYTPSYPFF